MACHPRFVFGRAAVENPTSCGRNRQPGRASEDASWVYWTAQVPFQLEYASKKSLCSLLRKGRPSQSITGAILSKNRSRIRPRPAQQASPQALAIVELPSGALKASQGAATRAMTTLTPVMQLTPGAKTWEKRSCKPEPWLPERGSLPDGTAPVGHTLESRAEAISKESIELPLHSAMLNNGKTLSALTMVTAETGDTRERTCRWKRG